MKRISLVLVLFCMVIAGYSQVISSTKGHFNMSCPSGYAKDKIVNAPHMLLKLTNNKNNEIDISMWEYGLDESFTMWDEEIYETCASNARSIPNVSSMKIDKTTMKFKNKSIKAVRITSSMSKKLPSYAKPMIINTITYQYLFKGNLMQIVFSSSNNSGALSVVACDKIISTITLTN